MHVLRGRQLCFYAALECEWSVQKTQSPFGDSKVCCIGVDDKISLTVGSTGKRSATQDLYTLVFYTDGKIKVYKGSPVVEGTLKVVNGNIADEPFYVSDTSCGKAVNYYDLIMQDRGGLVVYNANDLRSDPFHACPLREPRAASFVTPHPWFVKGVIPS